MARSDWDPSEHLADVTTLSAGDATTLQAPGDVALFTSEFTRSGQDLILTDAAGAPVLKITGFFSRIDPPDLVAGNGAVLRGDIAVRLAGEGIEADYAQAGAAAAPIPIGQVERLAGGATVIRVDGTTETLAVGMKIYQNDVLG